MTPRHTPNVKEIKLSKGKVALVSACDFEFLSQFKWTASECFGRGGRAQGKIYALRRIQSETKGKRITVYMHRFIASLIYDLKPGEIVDHIDSNPLNNTRENLRPLSLHENNKPFYQMNRLRRNLAKSRKRKVECFL